MEHWSMKRVANSNCRGYVQQCKPFQGSNLFANWIRSSKGGDRYVVYSFGTHFPMFIYTSGQWYENTDKYSRTTSKHQSQARPTFLEPTVKLSTGAMRLLAERGYYKLAKARLTGDVV